LEITEEGLPVVHSMSMRPRRSGRDQGAAAVEMALVMPILFMLLMGIINYGLWFNDSLSLRQGVREAARQAVVGTQATGCTGTFTLAAVACGARAQIGATGRSYAMVLVPNGWTKGQEVVVCGMVTSINFTGFVPLPAGGLIKSKTSMSIESVTQMPTDTSYADTPPTGGDWTWCTV
jgi:Flp pilus assembly protein TadG